LLTINRLKPSSRATCRILCHSDQNLVSCDVYLIHPRHPLPPARSPQKGSQRCAEV
jgi:hypothetical protein